jgi:CDP-diacylglycerol--serine O-phosphatidyltransferase
VTRKNRKQIFKNLSLARIIPNLATLSALLVGFTQVRFALNKQWEYAVIAVIAAAFLDATDGRLARLFNSCSRFGAELDSLSDFAVFGLCPAVVMYLYSLSHLNRLGWAAAVFFAACMGLRLARFNTCDIENIKTPLSGKFFTGVPAPAGAILALFPIILFNAFGYKFFKSPYLCAMDITIAGLLCISKFPTPSIKKFHIRKKQYLPFMLCVILMIVLGFVYTWKALSLFVLMYIFSIFVCSMRTKRALNNDKEPAH